MTQKISVLMVDDEAQFRATTSKLLSRKGFETTLAGSGEEAIEILKKTPHDVVILDIKMPGMDGHQALAEIKQIRPEAQVIMLTGHGATDSARESWEKGAYDYLSKPCDVNLLASKIGDAYRALHKDEPRPEKTARDIMIHISDYTTITSEDTVRDAIVALKRSFEGLVTSSRLMETGHRSLLVIGPDKEVSGILSIRDLIDAVRPDYLKAAKPSMADSMQFSAMFWTGLFTSRTLAVADKSVEEIMSGSPPRRDENTNLMELADFMSTEQVRRVLVTRADKVIGIVREQELFFEMARIIL
jgi:CheY-like chemotaxis protein